MPDDAMEESRQSIGEAIILRSEWVLLVGPAIIITYNERAEHRTERQTAVGRSLAGEGLQCNNQTLPDGSL